MASDHDGGTEVILLNRYRQRCRAVQARSATSARVCVCNSVGLSSERYLGLQASSHVSSSGAFRATAGTLVSAVEARRSMAKAAASRCSEFDNLKLTRSPLATQTLSVSTMILPDHPYSHRQHI
jgi:hypothetical protein